MIALAITLTLAFLWVVFFFLYFLGTEDVVDAAVGATITLIVVGLAAAALYGLDTLWERALS